MTEENQVEELADGEVPLQHGPGELLRRARETQGLSIDELLAQTKITRHALVALENDDFAVLNEPVYVRGYYRKCAKVLEIDEQQLLEAYDVVAGHPAPRLPTYRVPAERSPRVPQHWMPWLVYGLMAGALLLLVIWLIVGSSSDIAEADGGISPVQHPLTSSLSVRNGASDAVTGNRASDRAANASGQSAGSSGVAGTNIADAAPGSSRIEQSSTAAAETASPITTTGDSSNTGSPTRPRASDASSDGDEDAYIPAGDADEGILALDFIETSWVRIEDDAGKRLLAGLVSEGRRRRVSGAPPYTVFLGYAPGVVMNIDGQPVDFTQYIRSNNTARFTVSVR